MKTYALLVVLMLCFIFSHSVAGGDERDIKKCKKKVEKLLEKAEKAKYRSQSEGFLEAARIQSDLCYVMSLHNKEQNEECKEKVEELLEKAEEAEYRARRNSFLEAARIELNHCYGRSSPKKEQSVTGPLNHIGGQNFVDSDGNVWHCPGVMSSRTINIDRDCTPQ